jgi:uncharacterized protein YqgC (DUF456 family)
MVNHVDDFTGGEIMIVTIIRFIFSLEFSGGVIFGAIVGAIVTALIIRNNLPKAIQVSNALGQVEKAAKTASNSINQVTK